MGQVTQKETALDLIHQVSKEISIIRYKKAFSSLASVNCLCDVEPSTLQPFLPFTCPKW